MIHRYFPHTESDISAMLKRCGLTGLDGLYADVPEQLLLKRDYRLPSEKSEKEVREFFDRLGKLNRQLVCFAGNGWYHHFCPAVIPYILQRSEFLTAYTPYQPEVSQGTLQYIFEYQSIMSRLTGLEISNASMYDGATATAEAMLMMVGAARKRNRVLASATLLPQILSVVATYARYHGVTLDIIPEHDGITDLTALGNMLSDGQPVAGVILPQPNRYGIIEDFTGIADMIHEAKALLTLNCVASTLAVLRSPGEWGADIACGDGQSLGIPLNYGGPYIGFLCCTKPLMRRLPGRIVGATRDRDGQRVFVLTLQAREQHIRREKATSNICSNQGLMALHVAAYTSLLGTAGLQKVNEQGAAGLGYLLHLLKETGAATPAYPDHTVLNEILLRTSRNVDDIMACGIEAGILPGVRIADNLLLVAVTEMQTKEQIECLAGIISGNATIKAS